MKPTDRTLPPNIRKVEFEYDGSDSPFTQFLASLAHEYIRREECTQTGTNCGHSVEFPVKA